MFLFETQILPTLKKNLQKCKKVQCQLLFVQVDAHVDTLVSEQASYILNRVDLGQIYATIQQRDQIKVCTLQLLNINYLKKRN